MIFSSCTTDVQLRKKVSDFCTHIYSVIHQGNTIPVFLKVTLTECKSLIWTVQVPGKQTMLCISKAGVNSLIPVLSCFRLYEACVKEDRRGTLNTMEQSGQRLLNTLDTFLLVVVPLQQYKQ